MGHFGSTCVAGRCPRRSFCTFGGTLGTPGGPEGPIWLHFESLWEPNVLIWEAFGHHLAPCGWLWATTENCNILVRILHFRPLWDPLGGHFCTKSL